MKLIFTGIFLAQVAATLFMVGVIWFVQIVHYPLFRRIDPERFGDYAMAHTRLTLLVVAPAMLIEAGTAFTLILIRPITIPAWQAWSGFGLVLVIWLSTAYLQVPRHNRLQHGFDLAAYRFLIASNWLRTAAWTVRGLLVLWMVAGIIG